MHKVKLQEPPRGIGTFYLPTNKELVNLSVGDNVKVIFDKPYNERMWVIITKKIKDGYEGQEFEGLLNNVPLTRNKLKLGSKIRFNAKHVISIMKGKKEDVAEFKKSLR